MPKEILKCVKCDYKTEWYKSAWYECFDYCIDLNNNLFLCDDCVTRIIGEWIEKKKGELK